MIRAIRYAQHIAPCSGNGTWYLPSVPPIALAESSPQRSFPSGGHGEITGESQRATLLQIDMCTVTFIARKHGYALGMNRDEKLTRPKGRLPKVRRLNGIKVLCPSESNGGTWIAMN